MLDSLRYLRSLKQWMVFTWYLLPSYVYDTFMSGNISWYERTVLQIIWPIAALCTFVEQIASEWKNNTFTIVDEDEDIHTANERRLKVVNMLKSVACYGVSMMSPISCKLIFNCSCFDYKTFFIETIWYIYFAWWCRS